MLSVLSFSHSLVLLHSRSRILSFSQSLGLVYAVVVLIRQCVVFMRVNSVACTSSRNRQSLHRVRFALFLGRGTHNYLKVEPIKQPENFL